MTDLHYIQNLLIVISASSNSASHIANKITQPIKLRRAWKRLIDFFKCEAGVNSELEIALLKL